VLADILAFASARFFFACLLILLVPILLGRSTPLTQSVAY
jgi:hypothetical protein